MSKYRTYAQQLDKSFKACRAVTQQHPSEEEATDPRGEWAEFERERERLTTALEQSIKLDVMKSWNELIHISEFCSGKTQNTPQEALAAANWWERLTANTIERF